MQFEEVRKALLNKLDRTHFVWNTVSLAPGVTINISNVVIIDGFYLPVTARETFEIARRYLYYPLTRAVADQIQNRAFFIPYEWQPELFDFEKYTQYLAFKNYDGFSKFGAHKLWVLSHRRGVGNTKAINYGFYELSENQPSGTLKRGGNHLYTKYNPKQSLGGVHDDNHWDYSQLLQLMYSPNTLTIDGEKLSLRMALLAGKTVLTDEGNLDVDDLPF